ncbi:MAG: XisH protein [Roseofilum sp. Guam]|nr:XisH protein [Roseofilum sp. Guam]
MYIAIPQKVFSDFFTEELPQLIIELNNLKILTFNPEREEVVQWIN